MRTGHVLRHQVHGQVGQRPVPISNVRRLDRAAKTDRQDTVKAERCTHTVIVRDRINDKADKTGHGHWRPGRDEAGRNGHQTDTAMAVTRHLVVAPDIQ